MAQLGVGVGSNTPVCYSVPTATLDNRMSANMSPPSGSIAIAGAGSIGCFVGGMLASAGKSVALLARPRIIAEIESDGVQLTTSEGSSITEL